MTKKMKNQRNTNFITTIFRLTLIFVIAAIPVATWAVAKDAPGRPASADRASPEAGFGDKSPEEMMKEKPRDTKIGALGDMSGELMDFGRETANGAELAADEVNAAGGVKGKEFDLLVFDTGGSVAGARQGVETFLKYRAVAVVGAATGEVSFAANKMINENQLIMMSAGSRRRLGDTGPYNFRNSLNDSDGVDGLLDWVLKNRKWKRFALFSSVVDDYSIQLNAVFKAEMIKRKMDITHELYIWSNGMDSVLPEERGVVPQLKQMVGNPPDAVVFTGGPAEAADLIRELRKMGFNMPMLGFEDLMADEFLELKDLAVGSVVYSGFDPKSAHPKTAAFVKNYTEKFGKAPTRLAALAYDSYHILAVAMAKAQSLRPSHVRKALMDIHDFDGVTGPTSIGQTREASKEPFIFEFRKDGGNYKFVNVKEVK